MQEDPDLALAKMLQAQEQAWLAMAGSGAVENLGPSAGAAGGDLGAAAGSEHGAAADDGPEELTDEEMARRLQEEVGGVQQSAWVLHSAITPRVL